tara:strand:+ start:384 stop:512 length:129 start_codon:yes stop_codon:yes gene_type:complete
MLIPPLFPVGKLERLQPGIFFFRLQFLIVDENPTASMIIGHI